MALPGDLNTCTVTGTYVDADGVPQQGQVTFTPSTFLTDATGSVVIPPTPRTYQLSRQGTFRTDPLAATDNTTISPANWTYQVCVVIPGLLPQTWNVLLPHSAAPLDISAITPVTEQDPLVSYLPSSGGNLSGTLTLSGSPPLQVPAGAASGDVLTSDGSGNAAWEPVTASDVPPATSTSPGGVQLAGDLGGTATAPHVVSTSLAAPLPLAQGGTGAGSAGAALTSLGAASAASLAAETARAEAAEVLLAPLASPALTGTPTAPTKTALTNSTALATTAYADAAVAVETSRAGTAEALKAPLASPALTGSPTAPTQTTGDNSTKIATDAFVATAVAAETSRATAAEALALPLAGGTMSGAVAMGSHKVTGLANGTVSTDAAAFGQIPASLPPAGTAGGVLTGTYPNPGISTLNQSTTGTAANITGTLDQVPAPAADVSLNSHKVTGLASGAASTDAAAFGQTPAGGNTATIGQGGTGQTSKTAAFNALSPNAALGDLTYGSGTNTSTNLAGNSTATRNFLAQTGTGTVSAAPAWGTIAAGDLPAATSLAQGAVLLDATAADIKALGAQSAGTNTTTAPRADHVHPTTGLVTSVAAADASIVVGGTSAAPTVAAGTLDVVAAQHPPAANWSNNSHKITSLANGTSAQDAAACGQIPADWINAVTAYAADNSNGANAQPAIQNALNAASPGQAVYLPAGTYKLNTPLTVPDFVALRGPSRSMTYPGGDYGRGPLGVTGAILKPSSSFSGTQVILFDGTGGTSQHGAQMICGITIDGSSLPGGNTVIGLEAKEAIAGVTLRDLMIVSVGGDGIKLHAVTADPPDFWDVTHVKVSACGGKGFNLGGVADSYYAFCEATGNTGNNWDITNGANSRYVACKAEWSGSGIGWNITGGSGFTGWAIWSACSAEHNTYNWQIQGAGTGEFILAPMHSLSPTSGALNIVGGQANTVRRISAIDLTATDIAALGTQAAGSTGLAADAGHVHPATGLVTSVSAGDTSVTVGGTSAAPTVATATLDVIATQHAPAANWSNNSKQINLLAAGSLSTDAANVGQIPAALPAIGEWSASDMGFTAWAYDPAAVGAGVNTRLITAATLNLIGLQVRASATVSKIRLVMGANGATLTSGQCLAGLYSGAGALLGFSGDQSGVWNAGAPKVVDMTLTAQGAGTLSLAAGMYYIAILGNGTTMPSLESGANLLTTWANGTLAPATSSVRYGTNGSGLTSLPTSFTPSSTTATAVTWWGAIF